MIDEAPFYEIDPTDNKKAVRTKFKRLNHDKKRANKIRRNQTTS